MKRTRFLPLAAAILGLVAVTPVYAVDFDWTNASGVDSNWNTAGNWTPAGPPSGGGGNFARFFAPASAAAVINANVPDIQDFLTGNNGTAGIRQVDHSAGTFNNTGWFRMGALGGTGDVGTYNLSGGQYNSGAFRVVEGAGQVGALNVSGTGVFRQNDVGNVADGNNWSRIGLNGTANVNLSGDGVISADARLLIGNGDDSSSATVTQTGGTFEVRRGEYTLGDSYGSMAATPNARHVISGGTLRTLATAGDDDTGGNITVGQWDNSNAELVISGTAVVRAALDVNIADGRADFAQKGTITQSGGGFTFGRNFGMSSSSSSTATYNLSGGNLTQDSVDPNNQANWNNIGQGGPATFNLSDTGVASFNARTHLNGPNAKVIQTGGLFEVRNHELIIADGGATAQYNISGGTVQTNAGGTISVGNWNGANGQLNVSGTGQVLASGGLTIGQAENAANTSTGKVTQTGGLVRVQGDINMGQGNGSVTTSGTYELNGGTLDMTNGNINGGSGVEVFNFGNGRLQDLANFNIGNMLQTDGVLAPGAAGLAGITTINGNYMQLAAGELEISILSTSNFDLLNVNGLVDLAGSLIVTDDVPGLSIGLGFIIVSNDASDAISGTFLGLAEGAGFTTPAGNVFTVSYLAGDGNDVGVTVVPEPTTGAMLLGAAGMLALLRRRRVS